MRQHFLKTYILIILSIIPIKKSYSDIFIVAKVNQEIITNVDLDFEKRYLVSLNPNLKKLDQNRITEYAKNSLINEKIKRIEIEKKFRIVPNELLLSKVIGDIYSGIGISSLNEFEIYLSENAVDFQRVKEKISIEIAWNDLVVKTFSNEIEIDENAQKALLAGNSLLPVGTISCRGNFNRGDVVIIKTKDNNVLAKGLVSYNYKETQQIIGLKSAEIAKTLGYNGRSVLVHRDDMAFYKE